MWPRSWHLGLEAVSRRSIVPRLGLAAELVRLGLVSVSSSKGPGLGLASAWIVNASASVSGFKVSISTKKSSCTSLQIKQCMRYWKQNKIQQNNDIHRGCGDILSASLSLGEFEERILGGCDDWFSGEDSALDVVMPSERRLNTALSVLGVNYRVVQKKRYPNFNFAIISVNVHRF